MLRPPQAGASARSACVRWLGVPCHHSALALAAARSEASRRRLSASPPLTPPATRETCHRHLSPVSGSRRGGPCCSQGSHPGQPPAHKPTARLRACKPTARLRACKIWIRPDKPSSLRFAFPNHLALAQALGVWRAARLTRSRRRTRANPLVADWPKHSMGIIQQSAATNYAFNDFV